MKVHNPRLVGEELRAIPRGDLARNMYRAGYEQARLNDLGSWPQIVASPEDAHAVALLTVRKHYPDFSPELR